MALGLCIVFERIVHELLPFSVLIRLFSQEGGRIFI